MTVHCGRNGIVSEAGPPWGRAQPSLHCGREAGWVTGRARSELEVHMTFKAFSLGNCFCCPESTFFFPKSYLEFQTARRPSILASKPMGEIANSHGGSPCLNGGMLISLT